MSPPDVTAATIAGVPARPGVEVRHNGLLIKRVSVGAGQMLVDRAWGEWAGTGRRRYVALTSNAPLSALRGCSVSVGTRPVRADQTCRVYVAGQAIGNPRTNREFLPELN
jgi:hypothetical protein